MTSALLMRLYCTLGECDVELADFGALIAHIVQEHPEEREAIEVRPRRPRRRRPAASPPPPVPIVPISDHLTEQTLQDLQTLTAQANTHARQTQRRLERSRDEVRAAITESFQAMTEVNNRVLAIHHRLMELEGVSAQTRRITEANAVTPNAGIQVEPMEDEPVPELPAISTRRMPAAEIPPTPTTPEVGDITNESLMAEIIAGRTNPPS